MSVPRYQIFRVSIALPCVRTLSHRDAFSAVEESIRRVNEEIQIYLKAGRLDYCGAPGSGEPCGFTTNFKITGIEITFMRDTGRFSGSDGEWYGLGEDRYHSFQVRIEFDDLTT